MDLQIHKKEYAGGNSTFGVTDIDLTKVKEEWMSTAEFETSDLLVEAELSQVTIKQEEENDIDIKLELLDNHDIYIKSEVVEISAHEPLFQSTTSDESFSKNLLQQRLLKEKYSLKCKVCNRKFKYKCALTSHVRVHSRNNSYICTTCKKAFTSARTFKQHVKFHSRDKIYECEICCREFVEKSNLQLHTRSHTGEKPYECDRCGMKFMWNEAFTRHLKSHVSESNFECKICHKKFQLKRCLMQHMKIHDEVFNCNVCNRKFIKNVNLQVHSMFCHTGDKPYRSKVCNETFLLKKSLKRHTTIHSRDKPLDCDT